MPVLAVSIFPPIFRQDSTVLPVITIADVAEVAYIKIADWKYFKQTDESKVFIPPNITRKSVPVVLRDCIFPTFTFSTGVVADAPAVERTSGEGYQGAIYNTPLSATKCSIQGKVTDIDKTCGISLQDSTGTIQHNYGITTVAHAINLGQNGRGAITELGVFPKNNAFFKFAVGDIPMIELDNGIVRYLLIKPDGTIKTLRTTRSKLTTTPKAEVLLYFTGSRLDDVYVNDNTEVSTSFENIGVAYYEPIDGVKRKIVWQKWGNTRSTTPIADTLEMADKRTQFTYANQKQILQSIQLTPKSYSQVAFKRMTDFFNNHKNDVEFIFVDYARRDETGMPSEFWARFQGALTDNPLNACIFEEGVGIIEDFRNDYLPREDDLIAPEVEITSVEEGSAILTGTASDNVLLISLQLYLNGRKYGADFLPDDAGDWEFTVPSEDLLDAVNSFYVLALDYAGNETQSNTVTLDLSPIFGGDLLFFGDTIAFLGDTIAFNP